MGASDRWLPAPGTIRPLLFSIANVPMKSTKLLRDPDCPPERGGITAARSVGGPC
jgi:hypothetical protein